MLFSTPYNDCVLESNTRPPDFTLFFWYWFFNVPAIKINILSYIKVQPSGMNCLENSFTWHHMIFQVSSETVLQHISSFSWSCWHFFYFFTGLIWNKSFNKTDIGSLFFFTGWNMPVLGQYTFTQHAHLGLLTGGPWDRSAKEEKTKITRWNDFLPFWATAFARPRCNLSCFKSFHI